MQVVVVGHHRCCHMFGSSLQRAQNIPLTVTSDLPLTSTLFGHWFTRFFLDHFQQPTQTAAPFRAHQFQPQPHDISIDGPNNAQQSPLSNTGSPSSDNSGNVMCPPLGNLIGNVASGVDGACAPHSSGVSFEHLVRELASQISGQGEQFSLFSNTQRQLRELTDASTLATEWIRSHEERANGVDKSLETSRVQLDALQSASVSFRLAPAKGCRIYELRLEQTDGLLRATLPARLSAFPCLWGKGKSSPSYWHRRHPKNGIKTVRLSKSFLLFPSVILTTIPARSSARRAVIMSVFCVTPRQRVSSSLQQTGVRDSVTQPTALWQCASPQARVFDQLQMEKRLLPPSRSNPTGMRLKPKLITSHFKYTPGIEAAPVVDRKKRQSAHYG